MTTRDHFYEMPKLLGLNKNAGLYKYTLYTTVQKFGVSIIKKKEINTFIET